MVGKKDDNDFGRKTSTSINNKKNYDKRKRNRCCYMLQVLWVEHRKILENALQVYIEHDIIKKFNILLNTELDSFQFSVLISIGWII